MSHLPSWWPQGLVAILLAGVGSAHALDCAKAVSTPDIAECAVREQKQVEARLNARYQKLMRELDGKNDPASRSPELKQAVIEAQRAWVKYREADCKAVYQMYIDGSARGAMFTGCMQAHAEQRIKALDDFSAQ